MSWTVSQSPLKQGDFCFPAEIHGSPQHITTYTMKGPGNL